MKGKTIKAVIGKKITEWLSSIEDKELREMASNKIIVTGGCIASMFLKEPVNDFDIYFKDRDTTAAIAKYYVKRFEVRKKTGIQCKMWVDESKEDRIRIVVKSAGVASESGTEKPYQYFEGVPDEGATGAYVSDVMGQPTDDSATLATVETIQDPGAIEDTYDAAESVALQTDNTPEKYRPVFLSTNAITLSGRIQIVLRFYGKPEEIHANYDYVHCTNWWQSWGENGAELNLNQKALEALLAKELVYVGSKYPVCSVFRMRKFIARGWTINAGQIVKMMMQISALDLTNPNVLEEQLTGVDVAYFIDLINKVKAKDPEKVNVAYLIEIIDRMF